ncbi:CHASE4 domain-containing protein [Actomonas aquatica]|uniref:CHASE4 domain-containing protein n=1 Tax=Actomonas aquatica TaxID=2866162 RepID=A0ABZ1C8Z4_9BACT|nr:CHASE4 domain-containing protein [Opitutus sp. WL0086]WRQ86790.1 CHASE4 domain-containing protein [Opitutus sp. WL0086]
MTLRLRLLSLLAVLMVGFALALGLLHWAEQGEQAALRANLQAEQTEDVTRFLELASAPLRQFVDDYSWWDDMVEFVGNPDPEWAQINLAQMVDFFDVDVMWVLALDGSPIHRESREAFSTLAFPVAPADTTRLLARDRHASFFAETPSGIVELRAAPIQPSETTDRSDPAHGWFVAGRIWHPARVDQLAELLHADVALVPTLQDLPLSTTEQPIRIVRPMEDYRGRKLADLVIDRNSTALAIRDAADQSELGIFIGFGGLTFVLLSLALRRWVLKPLSRLEAGLGADDPSPLGPLIHQPGEFGRLARLVDGSFAQKRRLAEEVSRRHEVAEALQLSETTLRQTIEERVRLGRDLHDSVIQTLYASGMAIATARRQLPDDPAGVERRLEVVQERLNETIRELRLFITGLEPEATQVRTFHESVQHLVDFTCGTADLATETDIDETCAEKLTPFQRAQLLHVIREALSNIVRHAHASLVEIQLHPGLDKVIVCIADDGRGLPATEPAGHGRGMTNIRDRVLALGGELKVETVLPKGARIVVEIPLKPAKT